MVGTLAPKLACGHSAEFRIDERRGTAMGHCLVRGVPEVLGACQFTGGSGSLRGFKADVTVTTVDGTIWHWSGARSSDD